MSHINTLVLLSLRLSLPYSPCFSKASNLTKPTRFTQLASVSWRNNNANVILKQISRCCSL